MAAQQEEKLGYDLGYDDEPTPQARLTVAPRVSEENKLYQLPIALQPAQPFDDDHLVGFIHKQSDALAKKLDSSEAGGTELEQRTMRAQALGKVMLGVGMHETDASPKREPSKALIKAIMSADVEAETMSMTGERSHRILLDTYDDHPLIRVTDATFDKIHTDPAFAHARQIQRAALVIIDAVARQ